MIVTGLHLRGSQEALQMTQEYPGYLYCTVGEYRQESDSRRIIFYIKRKHVGTDMPWHYYNLIYYKWANYL